MEPYDGRQPVPSPPSAVQRRSWSYCWHVVPVLLTQPVGESEHARVGAGVGHASHVAGHFFRVSAWSQRTSFRSATQPQSRPSLSFRRQLVESQHSPSQFGVGSGVVVSFVGRLVVGSLVGSGVGCLGDVGSFVGVLVVVVAVGRSVGETVGSAAGSAVGSTVGS